MRIYSLLKWLLFLLPWVLLLLLYTGREREPVDAEVVVGQEPGGRTSLTNAPFVHPRLVAELVTWVSDRGDQVVAIDLDGSEDSNRFCCDEAVMDELPDGDDEWAQVIEIVYPPPQIPNPER